MRWLAIICVTACGGPDEPAAGQDLFPLAEGRRWQYLVTEDGVGRDKLQVVTGTTSLPDVGEVFVVETTRTDGERVVSYQADTGDAVARYREEQFDGDVQESLETYSPFKLRVPKNLSQPGDSRSVDYRETLYDGRGGLVSNVDKVEDWVVEAVEEVTVPAGTFEAVRMLRTSRTSETQKRFWFVDGVGKVKEEASGQTEELVEYE